ncbi:MAG: DUF3187 domain-containing protein [Sulfurovum sp.]|nr:DUF3187 domain-containing protein [Sulfurovum sp.]
MNKNVLILLTVAWLNLFASSDSDMDGVEDNLDQCLSTPFSELVDITGCSTTSVLSQHHFDIIYGLDFSQADYRTLESSDIISQTVQVDYYYKNFSFQANSSYYNSTSNMFNNNGLNDSFIGAYYKIETKDKLNILIGGGIVIPTYKDRLNTNNTDYTASINFSYMLEGINMFAGYGYTIIRDNDIENSITYQNTNSYSLGLGFYPTKKIYVSAAYSSSESIYTNIDTINTSLFYSLYTINENWFTCFSYAYGLSDTASENSVSFRIGYYF